MKQYKVYKESGVEWTGDIPGHWEVKRVKFLFKLGKGLTITKANLKEKGVPCVNYGEIHSKYGFELDTGKHPLKFVEEQYLKTNPMCLIKAGDFVFADTSEDIEGSGNFTYLKSEDEVFAGYHTVIVRPNSELNSRFFAYVFDSNSFRNQVRTKVKGVKVYSITQTILKEPFVWFPSIQEQQQIVNYLNHKTQQIDQLLHIKEQKIALLQEKRTALINQAVTKGLDPTVEMKDSGVEWIGEIPVGWEVNKLKYGVSLISDKGKPSKNDIKISPENVESGTGVCFNLYSAHESDGVAFMKGDVLLNKLRLYLVKILHVDYDGYSLGEMLVLRAKDVFFSRFIYYMLFHRGLLDLLNSQSTGVKLPRVSPEVIMNTHIIFPPLQEQQKIVNYLDQQTQTIDHSITQEQQKIALLKEYRQTLISNVVTGKIRVCDQDLSTSNNPQHYEEAHRN